MSRGHPTIRTRRRRTKLSRLYISLFILSISSQTVSNMYSTEIFYIIAHRLVCWTVCPDEHTIHKKRPYGLSIMIAHNSDYRPVCRVSHTSCYAESFVFTSIIANGSSEQTICHILHTHWYGCPFLLFCLIANSSNGLIVWPESHTQLKSDPCLIYHSSQTFCIIFDGFHTAPFAIIASHTVSRRVSDRSVALAASCSSVSSKLQHLLGIRRSTCLRNVLFR